MKSFAENFSYLDTNCPFDDPVEMEGTSDFHFCGNMFRLIKNPAHLDAFRNIPIRPDDVFFATLPPSGMAKGPGYNLISKLTGAIKISGHTEFLTWETDPTGSGIKVEDKRYSSFEELTNSQNSRLFGTHVPFEYLPYGVFNTDVPNKVLLKF